MKSLKSLNKYFWKYKWLFFLGMIFTVLSNYFRILAPQVTKYVFNTVETNLSHKTVVSKAVTHYDPLVRFFLNMLQTDDASYKTKILYSGIVLMMMALINDLFMFLMRQTFIV